MNKEFNLEEAIEFIDNVYQHKFDITEETKEDGTQVVYIDKLKDIQFSDFERASFILLRGYGSLRYKYQQLQNNWNELKELLKQPVPTYASAIKLLDEIEKIIESRK